MTNYDPNSIEVIVVSLTFITILCHVTNYRNSIEVIVVSLTFTDHPVRCDQLRPKLYWSYCGKSNIHYNPCMWPYRNAIEVIVVSNILIILCDVTNYDPNSIEVIVVSLTFIDYPVHVTLQKRYWSYWSLFILIILCDVTNYDPNSIEVIVVSLTFITTFHTYRKSTILCDVTNYDPNSIEVIVVSLTFITILAMWPYRNVLKLLW